ncbi:transglycosylase SLT domain-containing protein [Methylophilus aquaticus]|nr:transglycosylase SLT domain-containing protein [Methylophilus aquaticus]
MWCLPAFCHAEQAKLDAQSQMGQGNVLRQKNSGALSNPYILLVSLAFRTPNDLGITTYQQAYDYYCQQARDAEDPNAQFAMGWLYSMGKGVDTNHDLAAFFFSLAEKHGHREAGAWLVKTAGNPALANPPACMEKPDVPVESVKEPVQPVAEVAKNEKEETHNSAPMTYPKGPIYRLVQKHAPSYDIEVDFAMAVIAVESGFNPNARSPKNAQGLMQLLPETQARFSVKDAYNPEQNIKGGLSYLRWLLAYFKGDIELVLAAYNAGENNVLKYRGIPPFPETQNYIKRISQYYKKKQHDYRHDLDTKRTVLP